MTARTARTTPPRLRLAALAAALAACGSAAAATPLYHLTVVTAPDASSIQAVDINDAGQMVGGYLDADFNGRAAFWDTDGSVHALGLPGAGDGFAYAINNQGQIVGSFLDYVNPSVGLLWNAATPDDSTNLSSDPSVNVSPEDINDAGVVVGGFGLPAQSRAFVWTQAGGLVDYGVEDSTVEFEQAHWSAVNASGKLVGGWNVHSSDIHATVGAVGTAVVLPMSDMTTQSPSTAVGVNAAGIAVGVGLADSHPDLVPVVFAEDGTFSEIPGATLDQVSGCAAAINDSGVIVGSAGIGSASGCAPGMQAWVYRDGTVYDLYDVVDDPGVFTRFQIGRSINASGVILGAGITSDGSSASFVLTPIASDAVFADGFDG
ncbi:MAG TPA: hypothetical protein VGC55_04090 [Dokdonella sp.]